MRPPGRKVYERGAHVIYEIDGAKDKVERVDPIASCEEGLIESSSYIVRTFHYSESSSSTSRPCSMTVKIVSPLPFLHSSQLTLFSVLFYVLTEGDRHQDHVIGFFSKVRGIS